MEHAASSQQGDGVFSTYVWYRALPGEHVCLFGDEPFEMRRLLRYNRPYWCRSDARQQKRRRHDLMTEECDV